MGQKKILFVDDDRDLTEIIKMMLETEGYEVVIAHHGKKALDISHKNKLDLILLDIMMPGMDGWDVLTRLKACKKTQHIPVAMITARINPEDKKRAFKEGAEEFMTKPLQPDEFIKRIERFFQKEREQKKWGMLLVA